MADFLQSADVARVLNLTPAMVRKLADQGRLPVAERTRGGVRLFRADAVERLRRQRETARAPEVPERSISPRED